jgi:hypothetical protein
MPFFRAVMSTSTRDGSLGAALPKPEEAATLDWSQCPRGGSESGGVTLCLISGIEASPLEMRVERVHSLEDHASQCESLL